MNRSSSSCWEWNENDEEMVSGPVPLTPQGGDSVALSLSKCYETLAEVHLPHGLEQQPAIPLSSHFQNFHFQNTLDHRYCFPLILHSENKLESKQ